MGFIYGPQYIKPLTYLKYENNLGPQHQDHEGNFNGVLCLHFQDLNFCCFKGLFIYLLDLTQLQRFVTLTSKTKAFEIGDGRYPS